MEQIFFLILVAVVGLLRWLSQAAERKRNEEAARSTGQAPASGETSVPRAPVQTEEERIRKFMEALGMPTSQAPPPQRTPEQRRERHQRRQEQKRKVRPIDPFPRPSFDRPMVFPAPAAEVPPPIPQVAPAAAPLPTRETSVLAEKSRAPVETGPEFGVRDIDEVSTEDLVTHSGLRRETAAAAKAQSAWVTRLTTHEGLRDAIVLREIFGSPRSMQSLNRPLGG